MTTTSNNSKRMTLDHQMNLTGCYDDDAHALTPTLSLSLSAADTDSLFACAIVIIKTKLNCTLPPCLLHY